jgi:choline dehydrogenase-like flavoprotein
LDPEDFEKRKWLPHSGWPIAYDDLLPYYRRAGKIMGFDPCDFSPKTWARKDYELVAFDKDEVKTKIWQFRRLRFHKRFGRLLDRADNIEVYLNAMMTQIRLNEATDAVVGVNVQTARDRGFTVEAKRFVLACGGIENARLLLHHRQFYKERFANDNIGRFLEHPHYPNSGHFYLVGRSATSKLYSHSGNYIGKKYWVRGFLQINKAIREARRHSNAVFMLDWPEGEAEALHENVRRTMERIYNHPFTDRRISQMAIMAEQFPNPNSRVTLSDELDVFGIPRVRLDWQLTHEEIEAISNSAKFFGAKLGQHGFGRLHLNRWFEKGNIREYISGGDHHMGTTRMASSPEEGIVDIDGKMFGLANFYIAGSSVFPTTGCANPTFTILALVIRMADHFKAHPADAPIEVETGTDETEA